MIDGYVTFFWASGPEGPTPRRDSGVQQKIPFFYPLKGLKHRGRRPITYVVTLTYGAIDATEVARLNQWLRTVPQALSAAPGACAACAGDDSYWRAPCDIGGCTHGRH